MDTALNAAVSIPVATTIELFASSAPVGSISFTGIPDPDFTGVFAGVASDTPFDRAILTFSGLDDAFAFSARTVADQGQTLVLLSVGVTVLLCLRARYRVQFGYR